MRQFFTRAFRHSYLAALLLISLCADAQSYTNNPGYFSSDSYWGKRNIRPGIRDTAAIAGKVDSIGAVIYWPATKALWLKTDTGWAMVGSGFNIDDYVPVTRSINTTSPLSGGGDLSTDRTLTIANAQADGENKGAATFRSDHFDDDTQGAISLDTVNWPAYTRTQSNSLFIRNQSSEAQTASFWITGSGTLNNTLRVATTNTAAAPLQVGTLPSYANLSVIFEGNVQTLPAAASNQAVTLQQLKDTVYKRLPGKIVSTVSQLASYGPTDSIIYVTDTIRGGVFRWQATGTSDDGIRFSGTSGVWRRVFNERDVNVDWYGPAKDGTTDDLAVITKAINSGYSNVILGAGQYAISYQITLKSGVNLMGQGIDRTYIIALPSTATPPPVGAPDTWAIYGEGTLTQLPNLGSPVSPQDTSISLSSSASVSTNDLILIGDTLSFNYSAYRSVYKQGEYFYVARSTTGTNVTVQAGLYGAYPTASTTIYKVNPMRGSVSNMTIDSRTYTIGIGIRYGDNYSVYNVKSINGNRGNINYYHCINSSVRDCYAAQFTQQINPYGIFVSGQNVNVERNYAYGIRHGITVGTDGIVPFINRGINIFNNMVGDSTNDNFNGSIDFHGNTELSVIRNNIVYGTVAVGGGANKVTNNTMFMGKNSGRAVLLYEVKNVDFEVTGNTVYFNGPNYNVTGSGFVYQGTGNEKVGGTVNVSDNKFIYNNSNTTTNTIYILYNLATVNIDFVASGNIIKHAPNTLAHRGIVALGLNAANKLNRVTITNNTLRYAGLRADYSKNVLISGNHVDSCNTWVVLCGNDGSVNIQNNFAENYAYNGGVSTGYFVNNASRLYFNNNNGGSNAAGHLYRGQFQSDTLLQVGLNNIYGTNNYSITGSFTAQNNSLPAGNLGIGTGAPVSTLHVSGSLSTALTSTGTNLTLTAAHHTVKLTATGLTITLPSAASAFGDGAGRIYCINNPNGATSTISTYNALAGGTSTTIAANSALWLQSNGTTWDQIK